MINWYPETLTIKEKLKMVHDMPDSLESRAKYLETMYGISYIIRTKEGKYELYYYDWYKKEVVEDKKW